MQDGGRVSHISFGSSADSIKTGRRRVYSRSGAVQCAIVLVQLASQLNETRFSTARTISPASVPRVSVNLSATRASRIETASSAASAFSDRQFQRCQRLGERIQRHRPMLGGAQISHLPPAVRRSPQTRQTPPSPRQSSREPSRVTLSGSCIVDPNLLLRPGSDSDRTDFVVAISHLGRIRTASVNVDRIGPRKRYLVESPSKIVLDGECRGSVGNLFSYVSK